MPWPEVAHDAALLAPYFDGFGRFYGDAQGVQRSYWALMCWLYAAPFAPMLRAAALRHDGSPLSYPVHAVLYGRSGGGKTMFSRVIARSMFGIEQMVRGQHFTATRALGLRDQLGAIPLLVDDVDRRLRVPSLSSMRRRRSSSGTRFRCGRDAQDAEDGRGVRGALLASFRSDSRIQPWRLGHMPERMLTSEIEIITDGSETAYEGSGRVWRLEPSPAACRTRASRFPDHRRSSHRAA